jgi:RimJ/RimL family protein N-acetyltransferase
MIRIETERFLLRGWLEADRAALATMHADPEVMRSYPAPLTAEESNLRFERYRSALIERGYGYMVVESRDGDFFGYVGIAPIPIWHRAVGQGAQIGWFIVRRAWGMGYATEAARAALDHGFREFNFPEVLAYTAPDNLRSQRVMIRLGLRREPGRDFTYEIDGIKYANVVYAARP